MKKDFTESKACDMLFRLMQLFDERKMVEDEISQIKEEFGKREKELETLKKGKEK